MKIQNAKLIAALCVGLLGACSNSALQPVTVAPKAEIYRDNYPNDDGWAEVKKQQALYHAQLLFESAYIDCQEYQFTLKGCDVLQRKRDSDERARLVSVKQQRKAEKKAAEEVVSDEAAELQK
jgi:hypothetical protein